MIENKLSPVLKWAGGKTQLLDQIAGRMPTEYSHYYEPFIGSAAVLLGILPGQAFVNDINEQLINLYTQLKIAVDSVITKVNEMDASPCTKELYYAIRDQYNTKISNRDFDAECAALMIWINKHCFNGLYRVNSKGLFNVPYNNKVNGSSVDPSNLRNIGQFLRERNVKITIGDFERVCEDATPNDFIYFDSPYVPVSDTANFTDYTKDGFTLEDHKRLAKLYRRLASIDVKVMLSNNDVPLVRELYEGFRIETINVRRAINRDATKRTGSEVIVTNY